MTSLRKLMEQESSEMEINHTQKVLHFLYMRLNVWGLGSDPQKGRRALKGGGKEDKRAHGT